MAQLGRVGLETSFQCLRPSPPTVISSFISHSSSLLTRSCSNFEFLFQVSFCIFNTVLKSKETGITNRTVSCTLIASRRKKLLAMLPYLALCHYQADANATVASQNTKFPRNLLNCQQRTIFELHAIFHEYIFIITHHC